MNSYKTTKGDRVTKSTIDRNVSKAKQIKLDQMIQSQGFIACEECGISSGTYLDCSHNKSVKWCQDNGQADLAWSLDNITIRCRKCHQKHDKL